MKSNQSPVLMPLPFAENGPRNEIPEDSQISVKSGAASLTDGFPPKTMLDPMKGGIPPFGRDMNGILHLLSMTARWKQLGGSFSYDEAFATNPSVGGYPKGAMLLSADGARYWVNQADDNVTNPEATDGTAKDWILLNADWDATSGAGQILNRPNLATVATSGSYSDLRDKPSIPAAQVNVDWDATSGVEQILNRPNLAQVATSGKHSDLSGVNGNGDLHISAEEQQRLKAPVLLSETIYSVVAQTVTFALQSDSITCSLVPPLIGSPVVFSSEGVLPAQLTAGTTYYVVGADYAVGVDSGQGGRFNVATQPGGAAIVMSTTGSGVHSIANPKWLKSMHNPIWIEAEVQGAGAGGGTAGGGTGTATGGGGGGYARLRRLASSLPDSLDIVVGAGGQPGPTEGGFGSHGGTTSLGSVVSATGGRGGVGSATNMLILGSTPGDAVGGDWHIRGEGSEPVQFTTFSNYSRGGSSMFGFGGMGSIRISGATPLPNGTGRGAGGAGGLGPTSAFAAGRGSDGLVILREYA